jgi:hypothetical protein
MTKQDNIPEAVSSVTYSLESPDGFNILFTVRGTSGAELLTAMRTTIEPELKSQGYKAQVRNTFGPKPKKEYVTVPNQKCPLCSQPMIYSEVKDKMTGQPKMIVKCSTGKYDYQTKQQSGCTFINWDDHTEEFNKLSKQVT